MKPLAVFLILLFCAPFGLAQEVLSYRLTPGEVFTVKQEATQVITQQLEDSERRITNTLGGVMEFRVLEENPAGYRLSMVFRDFNMSVDSDRHGNLISVNAKEIVEDDPQSRIFNSILDIPVELQLAKDGRIIRVTGGDSLVLKMVQASGIENEVQMEMMVNSLKEDFGSKALSDSYQQMTYFYPAGPVGIGDTWENDYAGKMAARNSWTLHSIDSLSTGIIGTGIVEISLDTPTPMVLSGNHKTTIETDRKTGFLTFMLVESTTEGFSSMSQLGEEDIPTKIQSSITYQLIQ